MYKMSYTEKMNKIGKAYDAGLVNFDTLTPSEKYMLNNYYTLKNERADQVIGDVCGSLNTINQRLDTIYDNLINIE